MSGSSESAEEWPISVPHLRCSLNFTKFTKSYLHCKELENDDSSDSLRLSDVLDILHKRNDRLTSIYTDDAGLPKSYLYYLENVAVPSAGAHFPVTTLRSSLTEVMFDKSVPPMWQSLNERGRDQLCVILHAGKSIWKSVSYGMDSEEWRRRLTPPTSEGSDFHSSLMSYGKPTPGGTSVLDYLIRGKDKDYFESSLNVPFNCPSGFRLEEFWELALVSGMANGHAHLAVYRLLEMVYNLLDGFEERFPKVWILNVASSNGSSGPSSERSGSSESSNSRERKRPRLCDSDDVNDDVSDNSDEDSDNDNEMKRFTLSNSNRQFVDLGVVSMDTTTRAVKHLILVQIHPEGQTLQAARQKFTYELIHVLQSQNAAFGLFFGAYEIVLYKAVREDTGRVMIGEEKYGLVEGLHPERRESYFSVGEFQKLVLDILACMLHGMKYFDVSE